MKAPSKTARLALPLGASALLKLAAEASSGPLYLVGGALRDAALGRPTHDLDLACFNPSATAARLARKLKTSYILLHERHEVYRVVPRKAAGDIRQIDLSMIQGRSIEEDLMRRDFSFNALAWPVRRNVPKALPFNEILDPREGLKDLKLRIVRCEDARIIEEDPLRILRAFRFASQLGFRIDSKTLALMSRLKALVGHPAGERIQAELLVLLSYPGCSDILALLDQAKILTALFPDLEPMRGCARLYYGEGGVMAHSLETARRADFLLHHLDRVMPDSASAVEKALAAPLAGGVSHKAVLILTALIHDIAKPETAKKIGGRLRFFHHDEIGAERVLELLRRFKFPVEHIQIASQVVFHHLRPGNLAANALVTPRAAYRLFRDVGGHALDLLLVCWADHASYLGEKQLLSLLKIARQEPGSEAVDRLKPETARKTIRHLQVVAHLIRRLLDAKRKAVPDAVIDGYDVMKRLKLKPGPKVGELIEKVREAQAEGKVRTKAEALAFLSKAAQRTKR